MPQRSWISHTPCGVVLIVVLALIPVGLEHHYGQSAEPRDPSQKHQPAQDAGTNTTPAISAPISAQPADEMIRERFSDLDCPPDSINKCNLAAQNRMADATEDLAYVAKISVFLAALGVFLIFWTLHYTRRAAHHAAAAAKATRDAVNHATNTASLELRARISVVPNGINQLIGGFDSMGHVAALNVGKLPASDVSLQVRMTLTDNRDAFDPAFPEDSYIIERVIQPGTEMRQGSSDRISAREICTPDKYLFVWGVAYYNDGYGKRRFTRFCHRYATAGYSRKINWGHHAQESLSVIDADKARYHTIGNVAD